VRPFLGLTLCLLLGPVLLIGCGPAVPPEELGTVLEGLPDVPGAEEPYQMPELGPPAAPDADASGE